MRMVPRQGDGGGTSRRTPSRLGSGDASLVFASRIEAC